MTIIMCYAPTEVAEEDDDKDTFYRKLYEVFHSVPTGARTKAPTDRSPMDKSPRDKSPKDPG